MKQSRTSRFTAEFHQTFPLELVATLLKLFHERKKNSTLPNSFHKVSIILTQNEIKTEQVTENYRPMSSMNIETKILNKILATKFKNMSKMPCIHRDQIGFVLEV